MDQPAQDPSEINALEDSPAPADAAGGGSDSLSAPDTGAAGGSESGDTSKPAAPPPGKKKKLNNRFQGLVTHVNIYLLIFILIIVVAGAATFISMQRTKKQLDEPTISTQELTQEAIDTINGSETRVGDPKQTLSIESNAIFAGKVLIRDSLDVAGTIKVGSALNLPGITVSGTSSFDQLQTNKLNVAGDTSISGALTVQKNLTVSSGASFSGPISAPRLTVQSIQISGDLTITRHIDAGGSTPSRSNGTALGSGGTSSVGGTDTAGTVTINTGSSPSIGCFTNITFNQKFNGTPHVVVTPVGSAAGGLNWYINRSSTGFSICTTNAAPAGQSFAFDYIAID